MIWKEEELCYPCSVNKGADQLSCYCEADLRLCFRIRRLLVFWCGGSIFFLDTLSCAANLLFSFLHMHIKCVSL